MWICCAHLHMLQDILPITTLKFMGTPEQEVIMYCIKSKSTRRFKSTSYSRRFIGWRANIKKRKNVFDNVIKGLQNAHWGNSHFDGFLVLLNTVKCGMKDLQRKEFLKAPLCGSNKYVTIRKEYLEIFACINTTMKLFSSNVTIWIVAKTTGQTIFFH